MKTITRAQLRERLAAVKGATFISISALVSARANKKSREDQSPNPFSEVLKLSKVNGTIGADYEASVNRQLGREGKDHITFEAQARKWGERVSPALVEKAGKTYLALQVNHTRKPVYFGRDASGMLRQVSKTQLTPFLPPESHAMNQGTDKEIVYRNYGLEGIAAISIGGEQFRVRD